MIDVFDYSDNLILMDFQIADIESAINILKNVDWAQIVAKQMTALTLKIAVQQIPEVVRILSIENVAIYGISPHQLLDE